MNPTETNDIVIFGMTNSWDIQAGTMNRNAAVLYELLSRKSAQRVLFVNFLPFTWKMSLKTACFARTLTSRLERVVVRPEMHLKAAGKMFYALSIPFRPRAEYAIRTSMQKLSFQEPLGISYHPLAAKMFLRLPFKYHIFEAVDDWRHHPSFASLTNELSECYSMLEKSCDAIITVSPKLRSLFSRNPHVTWIPNGVNLDTMNKLRTGSRSSILSGIPHPIIGYNGVIQRRIDVSLIEMLAMRHPEYAIVLIGPTWPRVFARIRKQDPEIKRLRSHPNIHLFGFQSALRTMRAILDYDVAILPHRNTELTQSMNPMKLYEYLAAGKPVVSTAVAGLEAFDGIVKVSDTPNAFIRSVEQELASDNDEKRQQRIAAVSSETWDRRVDTILEVVKDCKRR